LLPINTSMINLKTFSLLYLFAFFTLVIIQINKWLEINRDYSNIAHITHADIYNWTRETVLMKAIETLVDFVLLRGHYTAGGDRGVPGWDACARVQPLMADGVGARVCGAAANGRGSSKEKGRRGEDPRNREDHPVTLVTDRGEPLHARVAPSNANLLVSPCQLDDYHAARKKYSSWKTGNERNAYAHHAREREFRYHSAMRIAFVQRWKARSHE